jgi:central glycolytic genes regulator
MYSLIDIQKKLLPDLLAVMQKRYHILEYISQMEPVGRRSLAVSLGLTERVLRSEVEFLKSQDLISIASLGMSITDEGRKLLVELRSIMREISGIVKMEQQLAEKLGIQRAIIVSGNADDAPWVKNELGRATAQWMKLSLTGDNIIGVTGGTTMATVAKMLTPTKPDQDWLFVPARGGIGEDVKNQANTICSQMAENTESKHRVLYAPDEVSKDMYKSMIKDPNFTEVLQLIKSACMVLHGIGDAITMAERRKTSSENVEKLIAANAVGEAFGYYFNEAGEIVHKVQTVGLQLADLANIQHVLAVAGGASKAKAIAAYMKRAPKSTILITDEGAANQLLKG